MNEVNITEKTMGKKEKELEGWMKGTEFYKKKGMHDCSA